MLTWWLISHRSPVRNRNPRAMGRRDSSAIATQLPCAALEETANPCVRIDEFKSILLFSEYRIGPCSWLRFQEQGSSQSHNDHGGAVHWIRHCNILSVIRHINFAR